MSLSLSNIIVSMCGEGGRRKTANSSSSLPHKRITLNSLSSPLSSQHNNNNSLFNKITFLLSSSSFFLLLPYSIPFLLFPSLLTLYLCLSYRHVSCSCFHVPIHGRACLDGWWWWVGPKLSLPPGRRLEEEGGGRDRLLLPGGAAGMQ